MPVADLGGGEGGTCPPFKVADFFFFVRDEPPMRATDMLTTPSPHSSACADMYMPRLYMYMTVLPCGCVGVVDAVT